MNFYAAVKLLSNTLDLYSFISYTRYMPLVMGIDREEHQMLMAPEKEQEQVYTISDIAKRLRVSEQVVRQLVLSGELRSKRVGRQYRITQAMLDEYLNK